MQKEVFELSLQFYDNEKTAAVYSALDKLYAPEQAIMELLRPVLGASDMLDLGVGAGRTTPHFAPHVRRYVGCDFSAAMINACREKYPQNEFTVGDACKLDMFPDASFDFILFSFNGLDCMNAEMRNAALREMQRLLRPGGYFAFSSHNLQFIPQARTWRENLALIHPARLGNAVKNLARFLRRTRSVVLAPDRQAALITEMHLGHQVPIFFIRPATQVAALAAMGWNRIRTFPSDSTAEITGGIVLRTTTAPWIYYLCRKGLA